MLLKDGSPTFATPSIPPQHRPILQIQLYRCLYYRWLPWTLAGGPIAARGSYTTVVQ